MQRRPFAYTDLIDGGSGNDEIDVTWANGIIRGGFGDDQITLRRAGTTVEGGQGNDLIVLEDVIHRKSVLQYNLGDGLDTVIGFATEATSTGGYNFEGDIIDLSDIDGTLSFVGNSEFGGGAEVRAESYWYVFGVWGNLIVLSGTTVEVDADGDAVGDLSINLSGYHGVLGADDFLL